MLPFAAARRSLQSWQRTTSRAATGRRSLSILGEDDELYAEESVPETGEWAGCKRSFMTPLRIGTRGSETLYNREYSTSMIVFIATM